jgi:Flp pilus assembly protein TadG
MKRCPQCNRTYADDSITFCLADGALLSAPYDSEATQRIPLPRTTNPPPTEVLPSASSQLNQQKSNSKFIYAIIAVMAGLIVVLAGIIIVPSLLRDQKENSNITQASNTNGSPINESSKTESRNTANAKTQETPLPTTMPSVTNNSSSSVALTELTGKWQGQWSSPFGTIFSANLYLEPISTNNGVQGQINWTMKSTPQEAKQSKVGLTAIEYVKGSYNPETRMLTMEGYRKDDPNSIITLDKYRLVLAEGNRSLGGATWNHGRWRGRLSLSR